MVPVGGIIEFAGAIIDIPDNFQLCDGTNGTPDLRNRFVIGAGDTHAVDDTGGAVDHNHAFTGNGHSHSSGDLLENVTVASSSNEAWDGNEDSAAAAASGTTDSGGTLPPFYALAKIQRMM